MNQKILLGVAIVGILLVSNKRISESSTVRGIRNNNPGNIRASSPNTWDGQTGIDDAGFAIFKSSEWGIRAIGKLLLNYERLHELNTVAGIIGRYAPTNENNTSAYIESVAQKLGLDSHTTFTVLDYLPELTNAIIKHENGINPYSKELIENGLALMGDYEYA